MSDRTLDPVTVSQRLGQRVVGQAEAVREMATALVKKLAGLEVGNILLIGSSGTGKTTLMRAVEDYLAGEPSLAERSTLIRIHANILADESDRGRAGRVVLLRLLERARDQEGDGVPQERLLERMSHGIVFVDEVDKIRAEVGGEPHVAGLRAQESLLTLIENERIPFELPEWMGSGTVSVDASRLLFVCAGAFEGLYDAVYDRVTVGRDRGALETMNVLEGDKVRGVTRFRLRDWLRNDDLFDYGMTPQFLSRFESVIVLRDLGEDELVRIFLESPDSGYQQARKYFQAHGVELALSPAAVRRIAAEAAQQSRLGARALREVFRRVIRPFEHDPRASASDSALLLDLPEVEAALKS